MVLPLAQPGEGRGVQRLTVIDAREGGHREQTLRCGKIRAVAARSRLRPRAPHDDFRALVLLDAFLAATPPVTCTLVRGGSGPARGPSSPLARARRPAPVEDRGRAGRRARRARPAAGPGAAAGETGVGAGPDLHGEARRHALPDRARPGLDYRELAAWNNIDNVNLIRVGPGAAPRAAGRARPAGPAARRRRRRRRHGAVAHRAAGRRGKPGARSRCVAGPEVRSRRAPPAATPTTTRRSPKRVKEPYSEQALRDCNAGGSAARRPRHRGRRCRRTEPSAARRRPSRAPNPTRRQPCRERHRQ